MHAKGWQSNEMASLNYNPNLGPNQHSLFGYSQQESSYPFMRHNNEKDLKGNGRLVIH
jgi:hypothetical protein